MSDDNEPIKYMDLDEFADSGFLQEANRMFFHPLGLALEVSDADQDYHYDTLRVWDYREDPEGVTFEGGLSPDKKARVDLERAGHAAHRTKLLGSVVQPIPKGPKI